MRNLFILLWRNHFTLLFLLLWTFCFYLVIKNNNFQQVSVFNSTNKVVATVMEGVNYIKEYINLKENNANLARENANLKTLMPESFYEVSALKQVVQDTLRKQQYAYINAQVVNNSVNRRNNYLTLDKGSLHGINKDMGVISSTGVVGIVKDVSDHYCTVMSVLHKNTRISTRFSKSNYFGSLIWEGENPRLATLTDIAKHVKFKTGDTLVTTMYSSIFPEGIMVGTVMGSDIRKGENFYRIHVVLSTNFSNLSHVYVVVNLMKDEQLRLEAETLSKDDN